MRNQWLSGYNRYTTQPNYKKLVYKIIIQKILDGLKNIDTEKDLNKMYNNDSVRCIKIAQDVAPNNTWAWDLSIIQDCAYAIHLDEIERNVLDENNICGKNIEL